MADLTIPLPQRLRTKADMIHMGEKIAWGSETALMFEAADALEAATQELESLKHDIERQIAIANAEANEAEKFRRAMIEAVIPLEAIVGGGTLGLHSPDLQQGIRDAITAVRAALDHAPSEYPASPEPKP